MPPSSLHDRYDILRPIAQGGMALVSLAREVDTGREVALKHLTVPPGQRVDEWRLRFQQEFHTTSRLRHPHIVATYDYATARDGLPFFTMEYLPGPGLEALVPMPAEQLQSLLPGLLQALGYLHHQGLVHCDLKPENLRLGQDGTIRLMDLGLVARAGHPAPGLQGTLAYMPPEVVRRAALDRRSDLYALGCVLYHLLAGKPPFEGEPREVLRAQLEKPPVPLQQLNPALPDRLCALVMRLLEKDPLQRFQSANEALVFLGAGGDEEDDQTLFHPPLLGRTAELDELEAALKRVDEGGFEEVWLYGDADAGLEQVLEEFCCRAQLNGCTVLRGAFRPRMAPFEGLRGVVRALVALTRHHLPPHSPHYAALSAVLPELGGASPDASDPEAVRLRVFEALTVLLRLAAESSVVLAFSNAHQADPAWREWLEYLHRNGAKLPVLVLSTSVGEPEVDFDPSRSTVELMPWSARESHLACCATLGQPDLPPAFTEQVHALAAGYPTRLEALLRRLAETGKLQRRQGVWLLPEEPVESIVRALDPAWAREQGLKRLSPLALALFEALLVAGREIELYLLWQVTRTPKGSGRLYPELGSQEEAQELFGALQELEEGGWVQSAQGRVALAAEQNAEALSATLAPTRLLQLHGAIASALETMLAQTPDDPTLVAELAHHALAAGDRRRGPRYALVAAQQHARLLALEPAEALLREGLAIAEQPPEADGKLVGELNQLRAHVARLAGDRRLAAQAYEKARQNAEALGDVDALAAIGNGLGRLYLAMGQYDDAAREFEGVLARLEQAPAHAEAAQALTRLGQLALARGDLAEARQWIERALAAARQGAYRALIRENTAQLGYLYVASGEERATEGLGLLFEAIQLIEKDEAKLELNACYALLGNAQLLLGRFNEAKLAFQRNCDLCAEIGAAPHDEASALMRRATVELELGDYSGARRSASPAGALARMVGNKMLLAQVRLIEGIAALYQGDFTIYQDAAAWVDDSLAVNDSDYLRAMWHSYRAEAEGYLGDWSAALSSAGRALTAIAAGEGHEFSTRAQLLKGEALTRLGLYKPARQALDEVGNPRSEAMSARLLLARAQLERLDGNPADARALGQRAIELARRAGVVPVAAACAMLLARVAPARDEALAWSRRALIDAETCNQPALEAEALHQAASSVRNPAQAELFLAAAEEAWRRAIAGLTSATLEAFGNTEERQPLKKLLSARASQGERLPPEDQALLLELLALPPTPESWLPALVALCRRLAPVERVAIAFRREEHSIYVAEHGPVYAGAATAGTEFGMAEAAPPGVWLKAYHEAEDAPPFARLLLVGVPLEQSERLTRMAPALHGALWAAWRFWLAEVVLERRVPQAEAPLPRTPGAG